MLEVQFYTTERLKEIPNLDSGTFMVLRYSTAKGRLNFYLPPKNYFGSLISTRGKCLPPPQEVHVNLLDISINWYEVSYLEMFEML